MDELYHTLKRQNNLILKQLDVDYSIVVKPLIKRLRKESAITDSTEHVLNLLLKEIKESQDNNIKYSTFSFNRNLYEETSLKLTKRSEVKNKYSLKEIIIISSFLIGLIGFAVFQIILSLPVKFDSVSNIYVSGNDLVFTEIEYAEEYEVYFYKDNVLLQKVKVLDNDEANVCVLNLSTISEIQNPGTYIIKIKVLSNDIYSESKFSKDFEYIVK